MLHRRRRRIVQWGKDAWQGLAGCTIFISFNHTAYGRRYAMGGMGIGICATIRWNLHIRMTEAASHGNRSFRPTVMCIDWWWRLCCDAVGIMRRWCVAHAQQGERTATFSCLQPHSNLTVSAHTFPRSMLMLSMGMGPISGTTVVGTLVKWVFCSVVHNSLWLRRCTAVLMYNNRIFSFRDNVLTNQR